MGQLVHNGQVCSRWLRRFAVAWVLMLAPAGAQNTSAPPMVPARVLGQATVQFTLNSPDQFNASGNIIITPDTTDSRAYAGLDVAGDPTGYGVTFRANYSISINGVICTGSSPNPCASTQPCTLSVNTSGEVVVPIQANIPGGTHSVFAITEGNPQSTNPVTGLPCNDLFLTSVLSTPNTSSFPAPTISFNCPPQQLCQAQQKVVPDNGTYSPPAADPVANAQYDFNLRICLNDDADCPTLEIADADTGAVLSTSDTPQGDEVVGQLINLKVQSDPAWQATPPDIQWTLPQTPIAISNYQISAGTGSVTPITDFTQTPIKFYWTQGGLQTVTVSATLKTSDGQSWPSRASVQYNVGRPQLAGEVSFTIVSNPTTVTPLSNGLWKIQEGGGATLAPGAQFTAAVQGTPQPSGQGEIAFLQVMTSAETCTYNGSSIEGTAGVDYNAQTGYPEPFASAEQAIQSDSSGLSSASDFDGQDSPFVTLHGGESAGNVFTINASFNLYVMYQPNGGIWVTIAQAVWNWTPTATWDGKLWNVPQTVAPDVNGGDSANLPTWSAKAQGCGASINGQ